MLDRLIDFILNLINEFFPIQIISQYEQGVRLRFGKLVGKCDPGLHFKIPFADQIMTHYAKDDTILLPSQKLTTKDGKTVSVRGVALYHIDDIEVFLLSVNNAQQAISDIAMGLVAENIIQSNYEDTISTKIMNEISKQVRRDCKKWGVYIEYVKLTDLSLSKSVNIFKEEAAHL